MLLPSHPQKYCCRCALLWWRRGPDSAIESQMSSFVTEITCSYFYSVVLNKMWAWINKRFCSTCWLLNFVPVAWWRDRKFGKREFAWWCPLTRPAGRDARVQTRSWKPAIWSTNFPVMEKSKMFPAPASDMSVFFSKWLNAQHTVLFLSK